MKRFPYFLTAILLVLTLLTVPVSVQAAPSEEASVASWGANLLGALDALAHSTWSAIEGLVDFDDGTGSGTATSSTDPAGDDSTQGSDEGTGQYDPNG